MKKQITFLCLFFFMVASIEGQSFRQKENTHRIMSYNIHHGEGMDDIVDCNRIGDIILSLAPEVVGLQEVDSVASRSGNIDILNQLAQQTGMYATFGASIPLGDGKYGNGILTKEKPLSTKKISLPGAEEARTALIVELGRYVVVNTHLSLDNKERKESVALITKAIEDYDKPVFLIGDLNAEPDSEPIEILKKDWQILNNTNHHTFPSDEPDCTIDYIVGYKGKGETYAIHQTRVIDEKMVSDHRPVFADIRLKTNASEIMGTIPYLQNPGTTEMTIMWLTNVPCKSWVEYGTDPNNLKPAYNYQEGIMVANNEINRILLTDLLPGKKYYYRVVSQEITCYKSYYKEFGNTVESEIKSFTTWNDDSANFRVIVYNDIHSDMAMFEKLHSLVEDKDYNLVIFNGDCFDDPEHEGDIVNRLKTYTTKYRSDEVPSIFMRGNHETRGEYSLHLWDYLGKMNDRSYSSFSLGDTRFVLLDCGEDKPDDHRAYFGMNDFTQHRINQAEFLKKEINSKDFKSAKKHVLIHHIPLYGQNLDEYKPCSELWKPILKTASFNISLSGHTHQFEFVEKGKENNNFPIVIGGGSREETGTVMVLEKEGNNMTLQVLNVNGDELLKLDL